MQIVLITLLFVLVYAWLLYPALLSIISRNAMKRDAAEGDKAGIEQVAVLFSAYNEEKVIRQRLENLIQLRITNDELRIQKPEARGQKPEARGQKPEARGQRTEAGGQRTEAGGQRTEAGGQRTEAGGQKPETRSQNQEVSGQWSVVSIKNPGSSNQQLGTDHSLQSTAYSPQTTDHSTQTTAYSLQPATRLAWSTGIQVFVGIDGSTDRTAEIAREFAASHRNVHVLEFKERRGKVAVLKDLVEESKTVSCGLWSVDCKQGIVDGEHLAGDKGQSTANSQQSTSSILVFTDANTMFRPDALERLLVHFSDPHTGGVCGRLIFVEEMDDRGQRTEARGQRPDDRGQRPEGRGQTPEDRGQTTDNRQQTTDHSRQTARSPSEGFYWRWETQLKVMESRLDSCLGANGAIYALRSELFWREIPENTVVDDLVIGMKVREQGGRFIYEPEALAEEEYPAEKAEWRRRVRIGAGDYQALVLCGKCLLPKYREFAWMFWSHKVLRWFTPHMAVLSVVCGLWAVVRNGVFVWHGLPLAIVTGIAGLLVSAFVGRVLPQSSGLATGFFRMCAHFVVMQSALFAGFLLFCKGNLRGSWERTPRG